MSNTLGVYNPIFYAQEALIQLENALGMGNRVHRDFETERNGASFERGQTISIRRPSTFTVQDAPSTAQDITTETVTLSLDYWKEVKFKLTDRELAFTGERIINDHIRPAAYALANYIDLIGAQLYRQIPWAVTLGSDGDVSDFTDLWKTMFNLGVPMADADLGRIHAMWNGKSVADFLALPAFAQDQGAGSAGVQTQRNAKLGVKYGFENFANQNVQTHTPGVSADSTGALNGAIAVGATSIIVDGLTISGTFKAGDIITITGDSQKYAVAADATADGGGQVTLTVSPPIKQAAADNTVATIELDSTNVVQNMAFHRNAFALVLAPLPDMARNLGAQVATISDPKTGLAIRSRIYYVGNSSEVHVALDVLFGWKTLDPNLAVRGRRAT